MDQEASRTITYDYVRDDNDQLVDIIMHQPGNPVRSFRLGYDESGRLATRAIHWDGAPEPSFTYTYRHESRGELELIIEEDPVNPDYVWETIYAVEKKTQAAWPIAAFVGDSMLNTDYMPPLAQRLVLIENHRYPTERPRTPDRASFEYDAEGRLRAVYDEEGHQVFVVSNECSGAASP